MTNHVHLLAIPYHVDSLARAVGEAHSLYTRIINFREGTGGSLFQGRYSPCPVLTDIYLSTAIHYILRTPVKAKNSSILRKDKWSSTSYHCGFLSSDCLVQDDALLAGVTNWQELLCTDSEMSLLLEEKNGIGRPF